MRNKISTLKITAKASVSSLIVLLVIVLGMIFSTQSSFAEELYPTGLATLHETIQGISAAPTLPTTSLPAAMDFTSQYPAVGNQGSLGSCVAFATAYAAESYQVGHDLKWNLSTNNHIFSPAFIYSQIHASNTSSGGGAYFSTAFNFLRNTGCTTLDDMPYSGASYAYETQPTAAQFANAANYKIFGWESLPWGNVDQIKAALANLNPVVIGMPVYPDFDNLSSSNDTYNDSTGSIRGYHAVCVVGYDDSKQAVKIINSWGTGWGLAGYGWISYDLIDTLDLEAYTFPISPWNFGITNRSGTTCEFRWSYVTGNNYAIYRKVTGSTSEPTKVQDIGSDNEVVLETPFGKYDYCVAIVDGSGNRISNFSTSTTIETLYPSPEYFRISQRSGLTVQFSWNGTSGNYYAVFRKVTGSTDVLTRVTDPTTATTVNAETLIGSCDFLVAQVDSAGNMISYLSNPVTVEAYSGAPTNFIANGNRVGLNIQFEWEGTAGDTYGIYRRVTGTTDPLVKVKETTSTIDTAVTLYGSCDFYVAKVDSYGNRISYFSNGVTVVY